MTTKAEHYAERALAVFNAAPTIDLSVKTDQGQEIPIMARVNSLGNLELLSSQLVEIPAPKVEALIKFLQETFLIGASKEP